jgi:hypothetical protein
MQIQGLVLVLVVHVVMESEVNYSYDLWDELKEARDRKCPSRNSKIYWRIEI